MARRCALLLLLLHAAPGFVTTTRLQCHFRPTPSSPRRMAGSICPIKDADLAAAAAAALLSRRRGTLPPPLSSSV